jgi:hypothetical protein
MVGEGAGSEKRFSPLIGLFGLYTAIGTACTSPHARQTDSFFFYLERH